ncbi:AAA family ATPase [Propionicicella superfundia]|uniref:AAA family ATPase n=1 Tax=Propionicicella superfundia TaxID=348582 RepID=UPI0004012E4D|nr:AAA family ATPase [Propionicicella superfundia]
MTKTLPEAVAAAADIAGSAGMDRAEAETEARQLSAAVAEPAGGAYLVWTAALGLEPSAEAFFEAAVKGRRFRASPTPLLSRLSWTDPSAARRYAAALADVCAAAAALAPSDDLVAGAARSARAAQASAVSPGGTPADPMDDFAARGPQLLDQVLTRLQESTRRVRDLGSGPSLDLSGLDPATPGAFDLTGRGAPPASVTPGPTSSARLPEPPAAQPTAAADEPAAPAETDEPAEPEKTVEELLAELDALVGLGRVKSEIHRQSAILRVEALRTKAGLKRPTITRHLIFVGNPGTGKTTVARLVAGIYKALRLLSRGQLVEVDRSELVAGYLGQTAMKTAEVVDKATGGVLFIDEAYALNGDQYGEEAINTLVKEMEDNRDDLVVIVAGYPEPMETFISQNPGLTSRFRTTITFDDYTDDELEGILAQMAAAADYDLESEAIDEFRRILARQVRDESFGNGRFARNVLEAAIGRHAWRLRDVAEPSVADLRTLRPADLAEDTPPAPPPVAWPAAEPEDEPLPEAARTAADSGQEEP